jgi:phenylpropionate dioxygenase-like ring-hydroxylating dioxygenase large terminal subunit
MADTQIPPQEKTGITEEGYLTDSWYLAAPSAELKAGKQQRIMVLGEPVVVGRTPAGEPFALRDICPHRLVPLSAGQQLETDGEWALQCPYHGWRFGTDGGCRLMPSLTPDSPYDASKVKVRRYPVHEANGAVYLYVSHNPRFEGEPVVPPPDFGPLPAKPKFIIHDVFNAHMDDAVVGLMDPAHVPFVHNQWWWRPPSAGLKLKEKPFVPTTRGWAIDRHSPSSNSKLYRWIFGGDVQTEIRFQLPGYRWEIVSNDTARLLTLTCLTPEAPEEDAHHPVHMVDGRTAAEPRHPDCEACGQEVPGSGRHDGEPAERRHGAPEGDALDRRHRRAGQMVPAPETRMDRGAYRRA